MAIGTAGNGRFCSWLLLRGLRLAPLRPGIGCMTALQKDVFVFMLVSPGS